MKSEMVRVFYATNRDLPRRRGSTNFGNGFHRDSPHNLRFGWAEVEPRTDDDYIVREVRVAEDPLDDQFDTAKISRDTVVGAKDTFEKLRQEMNGRKCDVICLLHGYASDFRTALARAAEISNDYATAEKPLIGFVFSWPSNGRMLPWIDYFSDRSDARASGFAIARAFKMVVDFLQSLDREHYCRQSVHLIAHSMGNWALANALDDIASAYSNRPPRIFDQIFLMAADVDNDALEEGKRLAGLSDICKAITIYFSEDDRALMVSDFTKLNPDRLGATGPRRRDLIDRKVSLVDCRLVDEPDRLSEEAGKTEDLSVHQYYRLRKEVIRDVQLVLGGHKPKDIEGRRYLEDDRSFQILPFDARTELITNG